MLIIPVIDLSRGLVVHAKQGLRKSYQPITSVLSSSAEPETVLSSFLELYPFKKIYIADLDAIQQTGSHRELILNLASHFKQCEFWIDTGINAIQDKQTGYLQDNVKLVLGSENKLPKESLSALLNKNPETILSLDFNETELIENPYLLEDSSIWPEHIICMMLNRVGSNEGVDIEHLEKIIKLARNKSVYAAGGVRHKDDLAQLKLSGAKGVLLATALHKGVITKKDINTITN
jgi:phosphoribosylformimino-5-aminoimidazole carboxamide ribotide isomerase